MTAPKQQVAQQIQNEPSAPKWVEEMHDHFRRTGFYRAEDLQRVLGDPRDHAEIRVSGTVPFNFTSGTS
jgi:hypothetical protein